jgi:hypothetical protein
MRQEPYVSLTINRHQPTSSVNLNQVIKHQQELQPPNVGSLPPRQVGGHYPPRRHGKAQLEC